MFFLPLFYKKRNFRLFLGAWQITMRIRWRNLELPTRVVCNKDVLTEEYGEFRIEPFERGFGRTIGNSLRRILLSAIEGCAVTSISIDGVKHEFATLDGVLEDVADIVINVKKLRIKMDPDEPGPIKLTIDVNKRGEITAGDIIVEGKATVVNKSLVLATLTADRNFHMTMNAKRGRGYCSVEENIQEAREEGVIAIASIYSPVRHVQYWIENTRVGKITNYDRLIMTIRTDGTISPEMALVESAKIFRKHINPFVQYFEMGEAIPQEPVEKVEPEKEEEKGQGQVLEKLNDTVDSLELGVRPSNCLSSANIHTLRDLVKHSELDLLKIRNFGKTSLKEIKEKLKKYDLSLGMQLDNENGE